MRIFLIGMPGAGKSYWGSLLSTQLIMPFFDLDEEIEKAEGMTIPYIFEKYGEAHFRALERQYLEELTTLDPAIIATGGGTPVFFDNINWINKKGVSIFINTPVHIIAKRLKQQDPTLRPLLQAHSDNLEDFLQQLLEDRKPYYKQAKLHVDSLPENAAEMAAIVLKYLDENPHLSSAY